MAKAAFVMMWLKYDVVSKFDGFKTKVWMFELFWELNETSLMNVQGICLASEM